MNEELAQSYYELSKRLKAATMKTRITATYTPNPPYVGQSCTVRGHECKVTAVYPAGTIDVVSLDGEHAWRISGLAFGKKEQAK
jgi:hypothetical protein